MVVHEFSKFRKGIPKPKKSAYDFLDLIVFQGFEMLKPYDEDTSLEPTVA